MSAPELFKSVSTTYRHPGDSVRNVDLFSSAWNECVELQTQSQNDWVGSSILSLQGLSRFEIALMRSDGIPVGAAVLAADPWDVHVGPCWSVFAQYVLPEYRLQGVSFKLMREAVRVARANGAHILAYTHRKGPWRYETLYRRIQ